MLERLEFDVAILSRNDKLTRYYTGTTLYNCFTAFVNYPNPKIRVLRAWKGSSTRDAICFTMFSWFISFDLTLTAFPLTNVSRRFKIPEVTHSRMHIHDMDVFVVYRVSSDASFSFT